MNGAISKNNLLLGPNASAGGAGGNNVEKANNIASSALIVNSLPPGTAEDVMPIAGSPVIDAGTEVPVWWDFYGAPRPIDGNDDNVSAQDVGAHEVLNQ
jgi:hypothetical protein